MKDENKNLLSISILGSAILILSMLGIVFLANVLVKDGWEISSIMIIIGWAAISSIIYFALKE